MKIFIKQHPLFMYFVLTFLISWSGVILVVGCDRIITPGASDEQMPLLILAMCAGPTISSILMTCLCDGKQGLRDLWQRLSKWKVDARWYAVALLTAPLLILALLLVLSMFDPAFLPGFFTSDDKAFLIVAGILGGLAAGIFEELGWTGFAIPRLRLRYGIVAAGLISGFFWGLWHLLLFISGDASGEVPLFIYLTVLLFTHLPAYRVLMVWLYDHTHSLFMNILMHTSLTACTLTIANLSGVKGTVYALILTAVLWIFAAIAIRRTSDKELQSQSVAGKMGSAASSSR